MEKNFSVGDLISKLLLYKDLVEFLQDILFAQTTDRLFMRAAKEHLYAYELVNSTNSRSIINIYKDLLQNTDLLNWLITELEKKLKYKIKFDKRQIDDLARSIYQNIDGKNTLNFIIDKRNYEYIWKGIDTLSQRAGSNAFFNLDDIDLEIGESMDINDSSLRNISTFKGIPIIYVNGNVITSTNFENREYYYMQFKKYCEIPSLHQFDIIKKADEEWKELVKDKSKEEILSLMHQYKCTVAIQPKDQKAILILTAYDNLYEAVRAFKAQISNCGKIFACNDSGTQLTRKAKFNRLMKKIG